MKPEFTKYGPRHNYIGAHVSLHHDERELLGTIIALRRDEVLGAVLATVQYFCGDPWPITPALSALNILERTYEQVTP